MADAFQFGSALPDLHVTSRNWTLLRAHDIYQIRFKVTKGFKRIRAQNHRLMGRGYNRMRLLPQKKKLKKIIKGQKSLRHCREG